MTLLRAGRRDRHITERLKLAAWAGVRNLGVAMRETPLLRPAARRIIQRVRGSGAPAAATPQEERVQEMALNLLLGAAEPAVPVPGRLVLVCGSLQPGGAERQLVNTVRGLMRRGFRDVTVLCAHLSPRQPEAYDFFAPQLAAAGAATRQIGRRSPLYAPLPPGLPDAASALPAALLCDVADLWRELIALRPEVVHAWLDWSNIRAGIAAVLAGVPRIILSGRNLNPSRFFFYEPVMQPAYRALLARPGIAMINNSRAGAQDYAQWLEVQQDRIGVVYNGLDLPPPDRGAALAERRRLGVPEAALLVGSMFRFSPEKRPFLWLDAAAAVAARRPDAMFALYGAGPMRAEIARQADALGLGPRVVLPGLSTDPLAALGAMDVFLLTSEGEGTPNTAIEAQWAGRPVVACAAGGMAEAFVPEATGILVPCPNSVAIADAVLQLAADQDWRARMGGAGPAFVASRFALDRMVAEVLAQYGFS